jgi:tyrosine-protein phosphatase non-receptor type 2
MDVNFIDKNFDLLPRSPTYYMNTSKGSNSKNRHRNRYGDILPYNHSLVITGNLCNDYINANKIPISDEKYIIATQGPLLHTMYDFWSMVLIEMPKAIVMLTPLVENYSSKCSPYWPQTLTKQEFCCELTCSFCKPIIVENYHVEHYDGFDVSFLIISRGESRHFLKHYYYHSWCDLSIPNIKSFLIFLNMMRFSSPLVIHCSAGVGRTGTLTTILRCIETKEHPYDAIVNIRKYRDKMVQTEAQYEFINDVLKYIN